MGALPATYACAVPRNLTTPQAAAFLGVDSNSIRAWAEAGHIRHTLTPGGHRRLRKQPPDGAADDRHGASCHNGSGFGTTTAVV